ncbi:adiponectin, C1Q and collagen domain containing, b [Genypterus blacodes]|uniref:adiponectin, C1Q and collagen domain containing, b n=1 Tax=Genypterus blacodes TaxID=154954 RepID=UPI003F769180
MVKPLWALLLFLLLAGSTSRVQGDENEEGEEEEEEEEVPTAEPEDEDPVEDVTEPEGPLTELAVPDDRKPCPMWMGGLPGNPGHSGHPGRDGRDGQDGPQGEKGDKGEPGDKGEAGAKGAVGSPGPRGVMGNVGMKGAKGHSALSYHASFSMGLTDPVPADTEKPIRFNKHIYNEDYHYSDATGKFHTAIAGVYFFTYHITVYPKDARVALFKNDKPVVITYDRYQEDNLDQASGSVIVKLQAGDEVWLQIYGDEDFAGVYADNTNDSTFSGFLLYPDMSAAKEEEQEFEGRRRRRSVGRGRHF